MRVQQPPTHAQVGAASDTHVEDAQPSPTVAPREDAATRAARVKASYRIEDVVRAHSVELRPEGPTRLVGLCPFREEQHPSFKVYLETQSFCCFGCRLAGDVITFVCLMRNVRFDEALRLLAELAPARAEQPQTPGRAPTSLRMTSDRAASPVLRFPSTGVGGGDGAALGQERHIAERDAEPEAAAGVALLSATAALGMEGLARSPLALTYLGERGISYALARRSRIGFLEDQALLDFLAGDSALRAAARSVGLLNRVGHGTLSRRLIVPEVRAAGVEQLIGRVLPGARSPLPHVKYYLVCGLKRRLLLGYGAARVRLQQPGPRPRAILVQEGALDYVVALGWDLPVLTVALLSSHPSRDQLNELLNLQMRAGSVPLILGMDADRAGAEGTEYLHRALAARQAPFFVLPPLPRLPTPTTPYKDLGEVAPLGAAGRDHVLAAIEQVIDEATPVADGKK